MAADPTVSRTMTALAVLAAIDTARANGLSRIGIDEISYKRVTAT